MFRHGSWIAAESFQRPLARSLRVSHCFKRSESFGRNDEQRLRWIEITSRFDEVGPVDIGNEAKGEVAIRVMFESFVGHYRPEVGTADTYINNVPNSFTGVPYPFTAPDPVAKPSHLVEHVMNCRHNIFSVDQNGCILRRP